MCTRPATLFSNVRTIKIFHTHTHNGQKVMVSEFKKSKTKVQRAIVKWTKLPLDLMNSRVGSSSNMLPNTTFFKTSKPFFYDYLIQFFRFYTSSPYLPPKERQIHTLLVVVVVVKVQHPEWLPSATIFFVIGRSVS